jgi:hypothetical protein
LEGFPEDEGQETDEDMGLDAVLFLVADGTEVEVGFEGAEGGFSVGELDIHGPEFFRVLFFEVGAKEIAALGEASPVGPVLADGAIETEAVIG